MTRNLCLSLLLVLSACQIRAQGPIPEVPQRLLEQYCVSCHDGSETESDVVLDVSGSGIDFAAADQRAFWERVLRVIRNGQMPPANAEQPDVAERAQLTQWIHHSVLSHTPPGRTLPRRLSRSEYLASLRAVSGLKELQLIPGFPEDQSLLGFRNMADGLALSPAHLEAFAEMATMVADSLFPPPRKMPELRTLQAGPRDLVISYSSAMLADDALRLGMKCDPIQRSCTWPERIEIQESGEYILRVQLSRFRPRDTTAAMRVRILARDVSSGDGVSHGSLRLLQELEVTADTPEQYEFTAQLYRGQTVVIHYANAVLDSDNNDREELRQFFLERAQEQPRYLDAWHAMLESAQGQGFRGGLGWERVKAWLADPDLPRITAEQQQNLLKKIVGNTVLHAETVVFDVFENGPALQVQALQIQGPVRLVDGPEEKLARQLQQRFPANGEDPRKAIERFLNAAFRRPVDKVSLDTFTRIHEQHLADGYSSEQAMHLVIRSALISPRFLYRCLPGEPTDDYDIAARLSFFLTGEPADARLLAQAAAGRLANPEVLRTVAEKMLPDQPGDHFVRDFTEQWLSTELLADLMPDPSLRFSEKDSVAAKQEVEHFFAEMLRENQPLTDLIDPDFTWTSKRLAENVYGLKEGYDRKQKDANKIQRVVLQRGGRHGGLLGMSAIMMATANGVDTQPVLRGVWVLENILGDPPPPPPQAVPPITPDTNGAKSPRELLALHTADSACAVCHRRIDPLGLLLENYDPVGRWRTQWPEDGRQIDSAAVLPDGTPVADAVQLRQWMVDHCDQVGRCLAEKLLTYATGRVLNYRERSEVAQIVDQNLQHESGLRNLLLALITSETFRSR